MSEDTMRVMVVDHKHYTEHFLVRTLEDILRAKAQMIRSWNQNGMFYPPSEPYIREQDREVGNLTDTEIAALPEAFRSAAKDAQRRISRATREYESQQRDFDLVQQILSASSVEEAIAIPSPTGRGTAVELIVDRYGQQEYTNWSLEQASSLTAW